jgi:hypothetical protein
LSVAHFEQRLDSGLPHSVQNFPLFVPSVPHLVQRIAFSQETPTNALLYHPTSRNA